MRERKYKWAFEGNLSFGEVLAIACGIELKEKVQKTFLNEGQNVLMWAICLFCKEKQKRICLSFGFAVEFESKHLEVHCGTKKKFSLDEESLK